MLNRNFLVGCGISGGSPHQCWRLNDLHSSADTETYIINVAELQLRAAQGGANQVATVGGTPTADSYSFAKYPSRAFDGVNTTAWMTSVDQVHWLRFDFNEPVTVSELVITVGDTFYPYGPTAFDLQYSDDNGASWETLKNFSTTPGEWASGESRTFTI